MLYILNYLTSIWYFIITYSSRCAILAFMRVAVASSPVGIARAHSCRYKMIRLNKWINCIQNHCNFVSISYATNRLRYLWIYIIFRQTHTYLDNLFKRIYHWCIMVRTQLWTISLTTCIGLKTKLQLMISRLKIKAELQLISLRRAELQLITCILRNSGIAINYFA